MAVVILPNTNHKLSAAEGGDKPKSSGPRNYVEKEDEILLLLEKINKKKTLCEERAEPQPGLIEELETLEFTLKGLQLQMHRCPKKPAPCLEKPTCVPKKSEQSSGSGFQSQETQTEFASDAYWKISMREDSINDQLCYLLERKTKLDVKEAALKKKEEELKLREEALVAGNTQWCPRGEAKWSKNYRYNNDDNSKYKYVNPSCINTNSLGGKSYNKSLQK